MTNLFTLDDINDIIEVVEDFLRRYNVRIPESDKEMIENGEDPATNEVLIYGMVYGDLQGDLLDLLEKKYPKVNVVNSWESEVEAWGKGEAI